MFDVGSFKSRFINGFNRCKEYILFKINKFLYFIKNIFLWKWVFKFVFVGLVVGKIYMR